MIKWIKVFGDRSFRPLTTRPNFIWGCGEGESEGGEDELKGNKLLGDEMKRDEM